MGSANRWLSPRTSLLCNLLLARTYLALGAPADARARIQEAQRARRRNPSATYLNEQLDDLAASLSTREIGNDSGANSLTAAELRVLPLLATHLSLQEIAGQLTISRNTAKSHSVAIYRKLGASSRSAAVAEARRLGYLGDDAEIQLLRGQPD